MKKIIIADDDVLVRRYLEQVIQEEMKDFELCGSAKNGREALKIIQETKPDIALIDIDMPEKDGVEVLYELKHKHLSPETKVVVLSCYNDFEYVKNAMRYGATDYILKYKVDAETLAKMLEAVVDSTQLVQIAEHNNNTCKRINNRDKTLKELLFGDSENQKMCMKSDQLAESLNIIPDNIVVAVGMLDYRDKFIIHNTENDIRQINVEIMGIIQTCLKTYNNVLNACIDEEKYVLIFSWKCSEEKAEQLEKINEILCNIVTKTAEKLQSTVTFGVSKQGGNITNIAAYYSNALEALTYKIYSGTNRVIWYSDCTFTSQIPDDFYNEINTWSQGTIFSAQAKQQLEDIFSNFFSLHLAYSQYNLLLLKMVGAVLNGIGDSDLMNHVFGDWDISMAFLGCETCYDHYLWFMRHIDKLHENVKQRNHRVEICEAIKYIEENLGENLTLSSVAEHVNFSKNYFSQLFKQDTGENLMDFIARLRINRAKELLVNSDDKVYEIAVKVGFESQHYFNRLFKSIVGVTPTEYRNIKCFY